MQLGRKKIMRTIRALTAVVVFAYLSAAAPANADPASEWNAITMMYVFGDPSAGLPAGRGGPPGLLDVALVHVAVHDAVQAIEGRFQPYHYSDRAALGIGNPAAAVAAAAHRMLVLLYGNRGPDLLKSLNDRYDAYLALHSLTGDPGLDVGQAAAVALHETHYRAAVAVPAFFGVASPGQWRSAAPMAALYLAFTQPFTLNQPSQFRPPPPPPLTSEAYRRDYEEVKERGVWSAHPNTDTDMARFWWTVNYFTRWNETVRQLASAHLNVGDSARLFALASLAAADAAIAVWDSKYFYNFWRPSTAIVEGDDDGNHRTLGDITWKPLVTDPPYPDYVSGANGLTAAFTGMLQLFFATDEMHFSVNNPDPSLISQERHFDRFSDAAHEVVEARILLGIHFRAADEEARRLGNRVAQWTFMHFLRPRPGR
jgi:hypothetical protein